MRKEASEEYLKKVSSRYQAMETKTARSRVVDD